jgi:hypothetical protein
VPQETLPVCPPAVSPFFAGGAKPLAEIDVKLKKSAASRETPLSCRLVQD